VNPTPYNPAAKLDIKVSEVPFRKTARGRQLMARIYQPEGKGPFPVVLDLHGGAWNNKDRSANEPTTPWRWTMCSSVSTFTSTRGMLAWSSALRTSPFVSGPREHP